MPHLSDSLIADARRLNADAIHHRRLSSHHRRRAKEARRRQAEIERKCTDLGIEVIYETGEEELSHGRQNTRIINAH